VPEPIDLVEFDEQPPVRLSDYGPEDYVALVFFWLLALTVFAQFFTRYVLNDSIAWTEEVARYLLICVTFIGGAVGVRKSAHIRVEFLYEHLPLRAARVLGRAVDLIRVAFFAVCSLIAWRLIGIMHGQQMASVDWPMSWMYGAVFAGFLLMTARSVQVAWRHWRQGGGDLDRPPAQAAERPADAR
jgi:TRAP-type C4-dicarboxylate transport system permease small subunit